MPFKSEQQRKFLWAAHPDIAKRWAHEYPNPKNLPKRVSDTPERDKQAHSAPNITPEYVNTLLTSVIFQASSEKQGNSGIKLNIPHSEKPVAAGDEHVTTGNKRRDKQRQDGSASVERLFGLGEGKKAASSGAPEYCVNPLLLKLAVVLSQPIQQALADEQAQQQGQQAQQVPANGGLQPLTTPLSANPLPLGAQQQAQPPQPGQPPAPPAQQVPMQPPQQVPVQQAPKTAALAAGLKPLMPPAAAKPAVAVKPVQTKPAQKPIQPLKPLGDKSNPSANPINAFGPISMSGVVNGNAALGAPGAGKMAAADGQKPPAQNFLATGATNLANTAIQHPIGQKVLGGVSSAYNSFMPQAGKNMAKKLVPNYASPEHIQDFGMQGKWQPDPFVDKSFEQGVHVNSTDSLRNTSTSTNGVGNNNEQLSSSIQTYRPVQVTGTPMQQIAHGVAGGAMPGQTFRAGQPAFLHQNMSEQSNSGTGASNRSFTEHLTPSVPNFQKQNAAAGILKTEAAPNWAQLNAQSAANSKLHTEAAVRKYIQHWANKRQGPDSWEDLEDDLPLRWGPDAFQPKYYGDDLHADISPRLRDPARHESAVTELLSKLNLKKPASTLKLALDKWAYGKEARLSHTGLDMLNLGITGGTLGAGVGGLAGLVGGGLHGAISPGNTSTYDSKGNVTEQKRRNRVMGALRGSLGYGALGAAGGAAVGGLGGAALEGVSPGTYRDVVGKELWGKLHANKYQADLTDDFRAIDAAEAENLLRGTGAAISNNLLPAAEAAAAQTYNDARAYVQRFGLSTPPDSK